MGVQVYGSGGEIDGYGEAMEAFRAAEHSNALALINHTTRENMRLSGVPSNKWPKLNQPLPAYDPRNPDNQWPVMLYHAAMGEKTVGVNLKGLAGMLREEAEQNNKAEFNALIDKGWRTESYPKPQIALLDPLTEKAALVARNVELEGKVVALTDQHSKLSSMFEKLMDRLSAVEKVRK